MKFQDELKAYAIAAGAFIMKEIPEWLGRINHVILFGSVAQGRAGKDSDVDLFFDAEISERQKRLLRTRIRKAVSDFRLSNEALKFKMKGISNEISVTIGKLVEWKSLKRNMLSSGITLYGKYSEKIGKRGLKHYVILFWEAEGKRRGALLNKLYGYKVKRKKYRGMIERHGGIRVGKGTAMIPAEHKEKFFEIMEEYGVNYRVIEVFA